MIDKGRDWVKNYINLRVDQYLSQYVQENWTGKEPTLYLYFQFFWSQVESTGYFSWIVIIESP